VAAGFRRRFRPPREPRRVFFFGLGCSPSWPLAEGASASGASGFSSRPSDGSGRWILGPSCSPFESAAGASAGESPFASVVAPAGFFLRRRPPREPRLVFFLAGPSAGAGASSVSSAAGSASPVSSTSGSSGLSSVSSGSAASAPAPRASDRPAAAGAAEASEEGAFRRRAVPQARRVGEQWFVPGFEEDDPIVVRGAQVLLSEELKYQIRNENDD